MDNDNLSDFKAEVFLDNMDLRDVVDPIVLDADTQLTRLTKSEEDEFSSLPSTDRRRLILYREKALLNCPDAKSLGDFQNKVAYRMWRLVTCLRLLKSGCVGELEIRYHYSMSQQPKGFRINTMWGELASSGLGAPYTLTNSDLDALRALWQKIRKLEPAPALRTSLYYFNSAYSKPEAHYKLVDSVISAESLFCIPSEQRFRVALYISRLVGTNSDERKMIFDHMKKAYDARCKIVHGRSPESIPLGVYPRLVTDTEEFMRRAIRKAVELGLSGQELQTKLDTYLLT